MAVSQKYLWEKQVKHTCVGILGLEWVFAPIIVQAFLVHVNDLRYHAVTWPIRLFLQATWVYGLRK